jgi:hypothetical protein
MQRMQRKRSLVFVQFTKAFFEFSSQSVLTTKATANLILYQDEMRVVVV